MAGSDPASAVRAFVDPIQDALGCFATGKVTADSYEPARLGVLVFCGGDQVRLLGPARLTLSVSMRYEIVQSDDPSRGPWKVQTRGWMYELQDSSGTKLIEYHWHPISNSHETRPHLHCAALGKVHVPTGRIMVEDVLNYAIQNGAAPRDPVRWANLDKANRESFARGATWGAGPV